MPDYSSDFSLRGNDDSVIEILQDYRVELLIKEEERLWRGVKEQEEDDRGMNQADLYIGFVIREPEFSFSQLSVLNSEELIF